MLSKKVEDILIEAVPAYNIKHKRESGEVFLLRIEIGGSAAGNGLRWKCITL